MGIWRNKISLDNIKQKLYEYKSEVDKIEINLKENDNKLILKEIKTIKKYVIYIKQRDKIKEVVNNLIESHNKLEDKGIGKI